MGGRKQPGLSPYWQWVVYTYGPPLLEALGTFRFLLTELVPLQLIFERRGEGMSLPEPSPPPAATAPPAAEPAGGGDIPC